MSEAKSLDWIVVPIAKFSHNSCPVGTRNFVWNHVSLREDMDIVFQTSRMVDEMGNLANRVVMKITAGAELLEAQDLGDLVKICRAVADISSGSEHPVQIVTKSPFLAMRYPQGTESNVRRIQVKFRNDNDFTTVRNILEELRLPVTTSTLSSNVPSIVSTARPPSISPANTMFSSASTGTSSPKTIVPSPFPTVSTKHLLHSSPTKSLFKVPIRPDSAISRVSRPASNPSYFNHQHGSRSSSPLAIQSPVDHFTTNYLAFNNRADAKNQTPSMHLTQLGREATGRHFSHPIPPSIRQSSFSGMYPEYTVEGQRWSRADSDLQRESSTCHNPATSPFFPSQIPFRACSQSPPLSSQEIQTVRNFDIRSSERYNLKEDTHDMIVNSNMPPKRTLPFPIRPSSTSSLSSTANSTSIPRPEPVANIDTSNKDTGKVTKVTAPKAANKRVAHRKAPTAKVAKTELTRKEPENNVSENVLNNNKVTAPIEEFSPPLASKSAAVSRPASAAPRLQSKAVTTKKRAPPRPSSAAKRPKMIDAGTQTQTLLGSDHTPDSQSEAPSKTLEPLICEPRRPNSPPEHYLDTLDIVLAKYQSRPVPKEPKRELWEAPGYAEMDDDERHILLNDFICENLDDPDFLQLLKDTDKAWRKVGFGK